MWDAIAGILKEHKNTSKSRFISSPKENKDRDFEDAEKPRYCVI
jgi:hypothetical protein